MTRLPQGAGGFDMNSMMKQLQQVQTDMAEAQEKLKDEVVEASAGGGMVKVKMSGDLRLLEVADRPRRGRPRGRRDALRDGHGGRRTRRFARPSSWPRASWAASLGGLGGAGGLGGLGLPGL